MRDIRILAGAAVAAMALAAAQPASADLLTFDGDICAGGTSCTNGETIDQSYGDTAVVDVVGIGNVASPGGPLYFWADSYSDLTNVAYGDNGVTVGLFLDPAAGYQVTLNGFDLGSWPFLSRSSQWSIYDGLGNLLDSSGGIVVNGQVSTHVPGPYTSAHGIQINWGPDGYDVGIDNVDFTVSRIPTGGIPEPSTWAMLIMGFSALGAALRTQRRRILNAAA